jgi:pimeloyl-ACP methyl ester carboxylesterase
MPFAISPNARLHYTVEGAGEPLLLIMGLGGQAVDWPLAFISELALHYSVIRMDNRGIGHSQTEVESWTLRDMADDACAVLDTLELATAHVLGISMGGMIAQLLAIEYPERVRRLVLMATSFGGRDTVPPEPRGLAILTTYPGVPAAEARRRSLLGITAESFGEQYPAVIDALARQREVTPTRPEVFVAQYTAIVRDDRSERVRGIHQPTLVLHGRADPLIPVENGILLAKRIPGARLCLLDDCGHLPYLEKTAETTQAILEFLAQG